MIKSRIFLYELKRAILSKAYAFLLLLIGVYTVYTLKTSVLRGFADTAPFSEWSFMNYLFSIAPLLLTILLFYVSRVFSPYEKNVMRITSSMPFSGPMYFLIKLAVITLAYIFAALLAITACFVFYGTVFEFLNFKIFAICMALVLIPQLLFLLGVGLWVSRLNHNFAFVLIAFIFLLSISGFTPPYYFDILGSSIMQIPQNSIPLNGVISFAVPTDFFASRVILCILGVLLIIAGCQTYKSMKGE